MSFSAGVFSINTTGQPVVTGTVISSTVFNALTADLATGLSTCVLKDGTQTITANIPMAGFKLTGLGAGSATGNSLRYEQVFTTGSVTLLGPYIFAATQPATDLLTSVCDGRLTLTSGVPVTTSDVTAAGTIYFTPYKGNRIALYDGAAHWLIYNFSELSLVLTLTSGKPYDVFCYDNAGVPTLETLVWTNDTTRATLLTTQNGVPVKVGATTRRYLGTIYSTGVNTTEDSVANRYVWNYYNRVARPQSAGDTADSWAYTLAAYREFNGGTAAQYNNVIGLAEVLIEAITIGTATQSNQGFYAVGVGIDSTTVNSAQINSGARSNGGVAVDYIPATSIYRGYPAVGKHTFAALEISQATGTTTWLGDSGLTYIQTGIIGRHDA